jgi:hypothetical protein
MPDAHHPPDEAETTTRGKRVGHRPQKPPGPDRPGAGAARQIPRRVRFNIRAGDEEPALIPRVDLDIDEKSEEMIDPRPVRARDDRHHEPLLQLRKPRRFGPVLRHVRGGVDAAGGFRSNPAMTQDWYSSPSALAAVVPNPSTGIPVADYGRDILAGALLRVSLTQPRDPADDVPARIVVILITVLSVLSPLDHYISRCPDPPPGVSDKLRVARLMANHPERPAPTATPGPTPITDTPTSSSPAGPQFQLHPSDVAGDTTTGDITSITPCPLGSVSVVVTIDMPDNPVREGRRDRIVDDDRI